MLEWSNKNKYNSFNSYKGLVYYEHYKQVVAWMDGADYLPPPIECNLDPIAECNLNCYFCITQRYLKTHREEVSMRKLPLDYMLKLVDFLAQWGVKGLCISGGGEPTLSLPVWGLCYTAWQRGLDVALVTNATVMEEARLDYLMHCRWIALSVDAADRETYERVKGADKFDEVIGNIYLMAQRKRSIGAWVDLCFKFLILPENAYSIYQACKLAKNLGVQDFHARPADLERKDIKDAKLLDLDLRLIEEQFAKCHEEETDDFHVYTVTHKFDPELHVKHDFEKCLATPLVIPILTDGNAYLCVDRKMEPEFKLGSCYPDPENILKWWGSDKHRELVKSVDINKCSRCTWSQYNRQIEEAVIKDKMCLSFP